MKKIISVLFLFSLSLPLLADGIWVHHSVEEDFDTIKSYIEEGITNQGLVVAHHSDVGGMLERTGKDLVAKVQQATHSVVDLATSTMGIDNPMRESETESNTAATSAFSRAEVVEFCSAKLSRKMTDADPANVIFCPYSIALYSHADEPGRVHISYLQLSKIGSERSRPVLLEVEALLQRIVNEAVE